jgi:hypothetical protein
MRGRQGRVLVALAFLSALPEGTAHAAAARSSPAPRAAPAYRPPPPPPKPVYVAPMRQLGPARSVTPQRVIPPPPPRKPVYVAPVQQQRSPQIATPQRVIPPPPPPKPIYVAPVQQQRPVQTTSPKRVIPPPPPPKPVYVAPVQQQRPTQSASPQRIVVPSSSPIVAGRNAPKPIVRQLSPIEARQISQSKPIAVQISPTAKTAQQQKSAPIVRQLSPAEARQISQSKPIAKQVSPTARMNPLPPPPKPMNITGAHSSSSSRILTQPGIDAIRPVYPEAYVGPGAMAGRVGQIARTGVTAVQSAKAASQAKTNTHASTPVGRVNAPLQNLGRPRYPDTKIQGTSYSSHAQQRMQERGIPPSAVKEAVRTGRTTPGRDGTLQHYDAKNNITVITDAKTKKVITTRYGR